MISLSIKWMVLWTLWAARLVRQPGPVIHISQGLLRGQISADGSHYQYFGIPYASSERQYRFQAPGPAPAWNGVREAIYEHIRCPQKFGRSLIVGQENCLAVNVYTPLHAHADQPLPVMVFIHGGGFLEGSGSRLLYGPDYLVAQNIVLVTFNYRLGVQGFLSLGIKEAPGNAGMKDQVAALKWVQQNIRAFGGDPDNVTIFGESAGGASVSYHLLSPMSRGLFHKAILQSGSSTATWASQTNPKNLAISLAKALGHDIKDPNQLHRIFMNEDLSALILAEIPRRKGQLKFTHIPYVPCIERKFDGVEAFMTDLPLDILASGNFTKVPTIIGFNDEEGYYFAPFEDNESLSSLEFRYALPHDLEFPSASERYAAGEQAKEMYMGEDEVSWDTILKLSKFLGESFFNYPAIVETELLLKASEQPIYNYIFEHNGWRNFPKLTAGLKYWLAEGAGHADELFYLFSMSFVPTLFETNMINTMTTFWTNFAKYGEPGRFGDVTWPVAEGSSPIALWLSDRPHLAPLHSFRPQHMNFWRSLFSKYRVRPNHSSQTQTT